MNFLYFSTLAWAEAGGAHNPTQMARALARAGHTVVFVEPQTSRARAEETDGVRVTSAVELGMAPVQLRRAWYGLESGDMSAMAANLFAALPRAGTRVAVYAAPFDPFVRLVPALRGAGWQIVYYAMDDFSAAPALGYTQFAAGADEYLARTADLRCGVTPHVARTLERLGKPAHVIPNGFDVSLGQHGRRTPKPIDPEQLVIGFWGTLMDSLFDAGLVAQLAAARPAWTFHLLGAVDPEPHRPSVRAQLDGYSNIILHGAVPHDTLFEYAARWDAAIAPFPDNAFTRGRDPIKVYEYLAAHLPVVAAHAPQLADVPGVRVADSAEAMVTAIADAARTPLDPVQADAYLRAQAWDTRAAQLGALVETLPAPASLTDTALLPGFAEPDAAAVLRYAAALEQELEDVQAWARELERLARQPRGLERVRRRLRGTA